MPIHRFKKGDKKPANSGRKKGTLNKFTTLKQAYLDAFNSKEMGSTKGLVDAFKVNPFTKREFYKLISKLLPSNMDVEHGGNIDHTVFIMPRPKKKKKGDAD